jgi:hypothetical protein
MMSACTARPRSDLVASVVVACPSSGTPWEQRVVVATRGVGERHHAPFAIAGTSLMVTGWAAAPTTVPTIVGP